MSLFRFPKNPELVTIPAVLGLTYTTITSSASVFPTIRAKLPDAVVQYTLPALFYAHVFEALLAGFRSIQAGRPAVETLQWMASTMIWGFASLGKQKRMLKIKAT